MWMSTARERERERKRESERAREREGGRWERLCFLPDVLVYSCIVSFFYLGSVISFLLPFASYYFLVGLLTSLCFTFYLVFFTLNSLIYNLTCSFISVLFLTYFFSYVQHCNALSHIFLAELLI
jgi:hypothetical protein